MSRRRPTILITGFGPFPGVPVNATSLLLPRIEAAAAEAFASHRVVSEALETRWTSAPERINALYRSVRPLVALHLGVSDRAQGIVVETLGRNHALSLPDAAGDLPPSSCIVSRGADTIAARLPVEAIVARLREMKVPVATSNDAGSYLCNLVLYRSLVHAARARRAVRAGFLHVPASLAGHGRGGCAPSPDCPISQERAVAAVIAILEVTLADTTCGGRTNGRERRS